MIEYRVYQKCLALPDFYIEVYMGMDKDMARKYVEISNGDLERFQLGHNWKTHVYSREVPDWEELDIHSFIS